MYNRSRFNRAAYNRAASKNQYRAGPVTGIGIISQPPLRGTVRLYMATAAGAGGMTGSYTILVHPGAAEVNGEGSVTVLLAVITNLLLSSAAGAGIVATPRMVLYLSTEIDLGELALAPGDVLVIDTDSITVTRNGISVIAYWQTGSTPFQLAAGDNVLTYYDASGSREAALAVVWKDRWL